MITAVVLMLIGGVISGQFHHMLGVAPILGAVLLVACFQRPRELFIVGLGGILVHDACVGVSSFTVFRLVGMGLVVSAVIALKVRPNLRSLLRGLVFSSLIFHVALAVGDWLTGTCAVFPRTMQGFFQSIATSLPYFSRSFIGDILFTGLFLGAYVMMASPFLGSKSKAFSWSR